MKFVYCLLVLSGWSLNIYASTDFEREKNNWVMPVVADIELTAEEHASIYYLNADITDESRNGLADARIDIARQYALLFIKNKDNKNESEKALILALKYAHSSSEIGTKSYFTDYLDLLQKELADLRFSQAVELIKFTEQLGHKQLEGQQATRAIALIQDAVELNPDQASYWQVLVNLYQPFIDSYLAKIETRTALKQLTFLEPENEQNRLNLIAILVQLNAVDELEGELEWLLKNGSLDAQRAALPKLTLLYVNKGLMQYGIEFYASLIPVHPVLNRDLLLAQAILHQAQGQQSQASLLLKQIQKTYGDNKVIEQYQDLWEASYEG